jgi:hypothetical protein
VLDVFEDGERLLPVLPGLGQLAGGVAGVAEVGEGFRFMEAVAGFPVQAERALVAGWPGQARNERVRRPSSTQDREENHD